MYVITYLGFARLELMFTCRCFVLLDSYTSIGYSLWWLFGCFGGVVGVLFVFDVRGLRLLLTSGW